MAGEDTFVSRDGVVPFDVVFPAAEIRHLPQSNHVMARIKYFLVVVHAAAAVAVTAATSPSLLHDTFQLGFLSLQFYCFSAPLRDEPHEELTCGV
ncbi:hypothetical protein TcWFU_003148 [Taenia crassiceps]|uniref:Uncharacterized protein n=1 Tax=Taenia crassiceps TaxID=6207 RepID=A0ABR4Q4G7_9CEST